MRNYPGVDRDPVAAGRTLEVDAILDGSIQRSGDRIRLTLEVLRTSDGRHLWTAKFDQAPAAPRMKPSDSTLQFAHEH